MLFELETTEHHRTAIGSVAEVYASKWSNLTTLECRLVQVLEENEGRKLLK